MDSNGRIIRAAYSERKLLRGEMFRIQLKMLDILMCQNRSLYAWNVKRIIALFHPSLISTNACIFHSRVYVPTAVMRGE